MNSKVTCYETDAYNNGWMDGNSDLIVEIYEGFNKDEPKWLLKLIGGKKEIVKALRRHEKREKGFENLDVECIDHEARYDIFDDYRAEYDCGYTDGYEELLLEIKEAYEQKKIEMPTFLQKIVAD